MLRTQEEMVQCSPLHAHPHQPVSSRPFWAPPPGRHQSRVAADDRYLTAAAEPILRPRITEGEQGGGLGGGGWRGRNSSLAGSQPLKAVAVEGGDGGKRWRSVWWLVGWGWEGECSNWRSLQPWYAGQGSRGSILVCTGVESFADKLPQACGKAFKRCIRKQVRIFTLKISGKTGHSPNTPCHLLHPFFFFEFYTSPASTILRPLSKGRRRSRPLGFDKHQCQHA